MTPEQQKAFSSWWLNEKYGGDLNNVEGLYQNETTGAWQADPNQIFDINPETGQKGQFKYMATPSYVGWIDVTPPLSYTISRPDGSAYEVEMVRNRHGLYAPEKFLTEGGERIRFNTNPNTGEEGEWIWLGTMGWTNIKGDPQPEPEPGTLVFGGGGQMVGPYDPDYDPDAASNEVDDTTDAGTETPDAGTETPAEGVAPPKDLTAAPQQTISSSQGGAFTSGTPMGLGYSAPQAQQFVSTAPAPKVDYAKALNSALALDVLGGMMTGRKV